tara:strand:- start:278 stop:709 length:432 start_codon:yes stop_codon:yes gene_type:complete
MIGFGQSATQKLLSTGGSSHENGAGIVEYSIGEISIETYANGSTMTQGFHQGFLRVSAVNEHALSDNIKVYPNPTKDWLNIDFEKPTDGQLRLTDMNGKLVLESAIKSKQQHQFNIQQLAQGTYFLSLVIDNKQATYQIQKLK